MDINIKQAKKILKEGLKDYTDQNEDWAPVFEGDIPEDDKKTIGEAEELVELAKQAEESGQEHPAIDAILGIAKYSTGDEPDEDEPEASGDEPWDGYDEEKVGKIIRGIAELDDDELIAAFEYEKANKNRDSIVEAFEETAAERGLEGAEDEPEEEESESDYKPWKKYDDDTVKSIVAQIQGMRPVKAKFWENMLEYEKENADRARVKSEIEGKLEELEEGDDVAAEPEETEGEDVLAWSDIAEMDLGQLFDLITEYEDDPDTILGEVKDDAEGRLLVAEAYGLEVPSEDEEPEDDEGEEGIMDDITWEVLEQMDLDELKSVVKEKELGFRVSKKTGVDALRLKIAEALDIDQPAPAPWRGYDGRDVKQIVKKLPKLDDEELAAVYAYESENAARKSIMKALEKIAEERGLTNEEPEDEVEPDDSAEDPDAEIEEAEEDDEAKTESRKKRRRGKGKVEATEEDEPDYALLGDAIEKKVEAEHYAVPRPLPENIAELPFDLTELSEEQLRRLHSANLSYFGRASYVSKIEKALAIACKHIADEAHDNALIELAKVDPETEKDKSATQLKAEAEADAKVRRWRRRQHNHEEMRDSMKADADIFKQNLDSLSRDWTMRIDEMDHSGGLGVRGQAAKKAVGKKAPKKRP